MYDESKHTQVRGTAVAVSGVNANPMATLSWDPERSVTTFTTVPAAKKLVITDFAYLPQGDVTSRHIINLAEKKAAGTTILLQLVVNPNAVTQAHFHTGFVVGAGSQVVAFTDANGPQGRHISLTLNGYLAAPGQAGAQIKAAAKKRTAKAA